MMQQTRNEATTTSGRQWVRCVWIAGLALALALGVAGGSGIVAPTGAGATSGPCGGYSSQEEAQADYDAGLLDPDLVDYDGNGIACEGLPSGGTGPVDVGPCGVFATQEEAQTAYELGELDPSQVDANGFACPGLPSGGFGSVDVGACGVYETQADAQADFDAGLLDPMQADFDGNGIACEGLWSTVGEPTEEESPQPSLVSESGSEDAPGGATTVVALPNTGIGQVVPSAGEIAPSTNLALLISVAMASVAVAAAWLLWVRRTAA